MTVKQTVLDSVDNVVTKPRTVSMRGIFKAFVRTAVQVLVLVAAAITIGPDAGLLYWALAAWIAYTVVMYVTGLAVILWWALAKAQDRR